MIPIPWFKVDDAFHSHPKTLATTPAALGLWVVAGSWAAANPDNGFVPAYVLPRLLPGAEPLADELVERRLWRRVKGGFKFRNWSDYQPSKDEVENKRTRDRERQRRYRAQRNKQITDDTVTTLSQRDTNRDNTVSNATPTRPDPTPTELPNGSSSGGPRKRDQRLPDDWYPDPDLVDFVKRECPNIDGRIETANFIDYWHAETGQRATKRDWSAAYRKWMRTAQSRAHPAAGRAPTVSTTDDRVQRHLSLAARLAEQEAAEESQRLELNS